MSKFITFSILLVLFTVHGKSDGQVTVLLRNSMPQTAYTMDFESVGNFSLSFSPWITLDIDHSATYEIQDENFPHSGQPFAFISFIPSQVSPPMTQAEIQPHSGSHFGACFSDTIPPNNDWFISPRIHLDTSGSFSFWVKSYTGRYGLEKYKVGVSVTDSAPGSFTFISGSAPLIADTFWTKRTFSLSAFNNRQVYVAIQCVSDDAFIFMIDDLVILPGDSVVLADFTADKTSVPAGASVNFTDQSAGNPVSWSWSFPGGSPAQSNLQNPSNIMYTTPGTYNVTLTVNKGTYSDTKTRNNYITVTSAYPSFTSLDFESQADFSLDFSPWFVADVNGGETYGIQNYTFTNQGDPFAFIAFNPASVVPAMTDSGIQPHSGRRFGACFSSPPPHNPNNKWLISPKMHLGDNPQIGLWVKTCNTGFDFEKYTIAVSTTGNNPSDFTVISGPLAQQAPAEWAYRQYSLADYTGTDVFIGIQCVSNDQFLLMVDDIQIGSSLAVNEIPRAGDVAVYPNPTRDKIFVTFGARTVKDLKIVLFNSLGIGLGHQEFSSEVNGTIEFRLPSLTAGVYYLSVTDETGNRIKKIIIEK
jgi:PKD repeat protein